MIEELRQRLQALQRPPGIDDDPGVLPLGVEVIDAALGGGLALGALHEIAAPSEAHLAAAAGFVLGLAGLSSPSPRKRGEGRGEGTLPQAQTRGDGGGAPPPPPPPPARRPPPPPPRGPLPQAQTRGDAPSPASLRSALAGDLSPRAGRGDKHLIWIAEDMALAESGAPYGPGLDAFGLRPERLVTVTAARTRDLLWAMEEALRCRAVAAVIGEMRASEIDSVAVRRLSLAAAESGALALLLRAAPPTDSSTAATRWIVGAAPSSPSSGWGSERAPRFAVQLVRNRRGPVGSWILQWSDIDERFLLATHAQPVAAPVFDRPHRQVA
jgi:protein ImuA